MNFVVFSGDPTMARPRRTPRTIVVNDFGYSWRVRFEAHPRRVTLTVRGATRTGQVLHFVTSQLGRRSGAALAKRVGALIARGLDAGWTPDEAGPTLHFGALRPNRPSFALRG